MRKGSPSPLPSPPGEGERYLFFGCIVSFHCYIVFRPSSDFGAANPPRRDFMKWAGRPFTIFCILNPALWILSPESQLDPFVSAAAAVQIYYGSLQYNAVGLVTNIAFPASGTVRLKYDSMNRLTNMLDGVGTTVYGYTAVGQLLSEDGPFASDTVTNTYVNRLRTAMSLQQPSGSWTNGFIHDQARRDSHTPTGYVP